jgi:hypothetical protein
MKKALLAAIWLFFTLTLDAQTSLPLMEGLFGPTTANAVAGNTGLTIAESKYGELVALKWPLPNYYDHLNYKGLYPIPSGWKVENYNQYHNAQPRHGSFVGIEYKSGGVKRMTWLRDSTWVQKQYYLTNESPIIVTEYTNASLQLTVKSTDFVRYDRDALLRKYAIQWRDTNLIRNAKIVFVASMAPCNKNPTNDPNQDWVADQNNGFANIYYAPNGSFVCFNPNANVANRNLLPFFLSAQSVFDAFVNNLNTNFPPNTTTNNPNDLLTTKDIYCIIGANKMPLAHGMDSDYGFAQTMPDTLIPNSLSITTNAAMLYNIYNIDLTEASKKDSITFQYAFAPTYPLAKNLYDSTFIQNHATLLAQTQNYWQTKLSTATMPQTGDTSMQKVLKRILVNTLISRNRGVGTIGSSVCASQPAYSQQWVRDASIMGYMLDCAGYNAEAEQQARFFANTQRQNFGDDCHYPANNECYAGTWAQCYYADGRPSWEYDFEIDEVGWGVWMLHQHSTFLTGIAKTNYLNAVYGQIKRGANFLKDFKDNVNLLQRTSREDDVLWTSQSVYGASTTLMGLKAAVSAGTYLNDNAAVIASWQSRITELEGAIQATKWGLQGNQYDYNVYGNFGPRAMAIWPALLRDTLNVQMRSHADSLNSQINPFFTRSNASMNVEWWYVGRTLTALAYIWRSNPVKRAEVENKLKTCLLRVPTEGTYSYGETVMIRDIDSAGVTVRKYDNRVGQPSNYPATWFYMTAQMLYGPAHDLYKNVSVGTNDVERENIVSIYPNPTNGLFTVALQTEGAEIVVTDLLGRQVLRTKITQATTNLQLDNNGVYFIYIITQKGTTIRKLVVSQ